MRRTLAGALALVTLTSVSAAASPWRDREPWRDHGGRTWSADRDGGRDGWSRGGDRDRPSRGWARQAPPAPALPEAEPAPIVTAPVEEPQAPADPEREPTPAAPEAAPVAQPALSGAYGVPEGVALTPMAGGQVAASGEIADVVFDSDVVFTGSDLTLRNVRVNGDAIIRGDRVTIERSAFGSLGISGAEGVTVSGVEIFGHPGKDGIHITSDSGQVKDVVIRDTLVHNPKPNANSHYDGIQVRGVQGLTLDGVRVELGDFAPQHNAALFLEDANGGNRDVTVTRSVLQGGGYTLYSFASNVAITDTVLGVGRWGFLFPSSRTGEVVEFRGNTDTSGRGVALRPGAIG